MLYNNHTYENLSYKFYPGSLDVKTHSTNDSLSSTISQSFEKSTEIQVYKNNQINNSTEFLSDFLK